MGIKFNALDVGTGSAERLAALMGDQVDVMVVNYLNVKDYIEKVILLFTVFALLKETLEWKKFLRSKNKGMML